MQKGFFRPIWCENWALITSVGIWSEYQTCSVFKWSKPIRLWNGSLFRWHLNTFVQYSKDRTILKPNDWILGIQMNLDFRLFSFWIPTVSLKSCYLHQWHVLWVEWGRSWHWGSRHCGSSGRTTRCCPTAGWTRGWTRWGFQMQMPFFSREKMLS